MNEIPSSVKAFYKKENHPEYYKEYNYHHRPRFDFLFSEFRLDEINSMRIADFGGGYSEILMRLRNNNEKHCFDGADLSNVSVPYMYHECDLNYPIKFQDQYFDVSIISETLEHLAAPYTSIEQIKRMTKIGGKILITIPDVKMTHNSPYFPLFFPETNFEAWLDQMALPRLEKKLFNGNWPSWCFLCENRPWSEKKMPFPKDDLKFKDATPLEVTNL